MTFLKMLKTFRKDEDGAVTVDWVVLTAACVGLGVAVLGVVTNSTETVTNRIGTQLDTTTVTDAFADQ